jgi:hypothetical protein
MIVEVKPVFDTVNPLSDTETLSDTESVDTLNFSQTSTVDLNQVLLTLYA